MEFIEDLGDGQALFDLGPNIAFGDAAIGGQVAVGYPNEARLYRVVDVLGHLVILGPL